SRTIEQADIVQPKEPALENVQSLRVFAVHPPGEVQQQLLENPLQELDIANTTVQVPIVLIDVECRPCVDRRIDVAERPLIGGKLAVRMHQPDLAQQQQLRLGELRIDA